ncbi:hypothetical protein Tcan_12076 [Toxocara canis]|uniref:Uncharacterized protein n=1 Tax=Toxocara canis TaxID=6265 RepID=A0A0B2UNK1_TOXCA|nr:hypothetical protein Tcan_12076 [Toxocara canis]
MQPRGNASLPIIDDVPCDRSVHRCAHPKSDMAILAGVMSAPKFDPHHPKYRCACSLVHSLLGTKIISICLIASTSLYTVDAIYRGRYDALSALVTALVFGVYVTLAVGAFYQRKGLLIPFIIMQVVYRLLLVLWEHVWFDANKFNQKTALVNANSLNLGLLACRSIRHFQSVFICALSILFAFLSAAIIASYVSRDWSWMEVSSNYENQLAVLALFDVMIAGLVGVHCWVLSVVARLYCFLSDRERIMTIPIRTSGFEEALKQVDDSLAKRQSGTA